ncbi:MAG: hypothetical protein O7J95_14150, partial [Planctomycetota bacterium]|nr:hypothetical protein [Planctomycetota bacterium]
DCKDKATLMTVMLGELGIDSQPVLIHADRRRGREDLTLPMVHHFNHCITYVPESSGRPALFLDGTAARHSLEELPSMDRGARVLIVREEEATVADIPWNTTADLSVEEEWTVDIREDRSARLEVRVRARGDYATSLRRVYEVAARRRETLERAYGRRFAGATVVAQSFSDLDNLDEPVSFSVVVEVPRFVSPSSEGPGIALPDDFFGSGGELAILGSLEKRQFDVLLGNPRRSLLRVRCRLPPELAWKSWPRARRLSGRHGRFEVEFDQKEGELHLRRLIEITAHRLSLDDYTAFREFTAAIASLAEEKIILKDS